MDFNADFDETEYSSLDAGEFRYHVPDMSPSGIHRAVLKLDIRKVKRCIESGESVKKQKPHCNFSALHLAVINNNLKKLDYLLADKDVEVNARCSKGRTPLYLAAFLGHIESVEKLIQAGADMNIPDNNNDTALHASVFFPDTPDVCKLLLRHGARIQTDDSRRRTLQTAVRNNILEILHMLLYYNVDANSLNGLYCTPFMTALHCGNVEAQKLLFEYAYDFNRFSYDPACYGVTMSFALQTNSPFVKDMIEQGADVNYGDDPRVRKEICAFRACLHRPVDLSTFKIVWERLRYNNSKNTIDLLDLFDCVAGVPRFLQVIIDSDNFETAVECFSKGETYFLFVDKFAKKGFDLDQLTTLTCRLLQYGYRASSYDIHAIFSHYGRCELFRMLLYMDNDFTRGWSPDMVFSRLIFDIHYDLKSIVNQIDDIPKETVVHLLGYTTCPRLIDALTLKYGEDKSMSAILSYLPRVPSLIELSRNPARKHIWQSFKVTNVCQFYTVIDHLPVSTLYKDILTFKRKMYSIKE